MSRLRGSHQTSTHIPDSDNADVGTYMKRLLQETSERRVSCFFVQKAGQQQM